RAFFRGTTIKVVHHQPGRRFALANPCGRKQRTLDAAAQWARAADCAEHRLPEHRLPERRLAERYLAGDGGLGHQLAGGAAGCGERHASAGLGEPTAVGSSTGEHTGARESADDRWPVASRAACRQHRGAETDSRTTAAVDRCTTEAVERRTTETGE